ncbi:MAG TPA: hypothetical protein ENK26_14075 [Gammaproteobacteria bacterium]|nr:hypothetical protein [Gammaproteobacteria bacterium]
MKLTKKTTVSLIAAGILLSANAQAGVEGNIGVASNYIWRGVTQTQDQAAISGGLDYSNDSGFYLGTWASNVDFGADATDAGYELDLYGGYGGEVGGFGYDVGYILYAYPSLDDSNFSEVYLNTGIAGFALGVSYQVDADSTDENYLYLSLGYDIDLGNDWGLSLYGGSYDTGADDSDYTHYGVSFSKGDFGLALDDNDLDDSDPRVTVSWSKTF